MRRPVTGPLGATPPRSTSTSTTSGRTSSVRRGARAPPPAASLQAVLPRHGLDAAAGGRAPAALGRPFLLHALPDSAGERAFRQPGAGRAASVDHHRTAAAARPVALRRL